MDLGAIQAAIISLKSATDIAKSLYEMKAAADVQAKVIEIQSALMAAQSSALAATTAQFELQDRIRELEDRLKAADDWKIQKGRYALISPWQGPAQAYALKTSDADGEAPHLLCANCFHNSKRVILNPLKKDHWVLMVCPSCKATIETGYRGIGQPRYAEEYESEKG